MTYGTAEGSDACVLRVFGELDATSVTEIRNTLDRLADGGYQQVVVDLSELWRIDSSGVAAIVSLYKRVLGRGGTMRVRGLRDQPLAIFRLLKLDRVLAPEAAAAAA